MLDLMRRHAASWVAKIVLGAIALIFVLYFGYSSSTNVRLGPQVALMVEETAITLAHFNRIYQASLDNVRENTGGEVPDDLARFLRSNVLEQLTDRQVRRYFAESLGFRVADQEVARTIRSQEQFLRDGIFDTNFYREEFRPYYQRTYGRDYEETIREGLLLDSLSYFTEQAPLLPKEEEEWLAKINAVREVPLRIEPRNRYDTVNLWLDKFRQGLEIEKNPSL